MERAKRYIVGTYHTEYITMGMGLPLFQAPGQRTRPWVEIVLAPNHIHDLHNNSEHILTVAKLIAGPVEYDRLVEQFTEEEMIHISLVSVYGSYTELRNYLRDSVSWLISRREWLHCEDDHCDFYPSTYEYLRQIADVCGLRVELFPLHEMIRRFSDHGCGFCEDMAASNKQPYDGCSLQSL